MERPLQIVSRDVELTDSMRTLVTGKCDKLLALADKITSCRVVIERPDKHKHKGAEFNLRIELALPGKEIVVQKQPNADWNAAVRDAFDAAHRLLEEHVRKRRAEVKTHEAAPRGEVATIYPGDDYGFLRGDDGVEYYFHRNSVLNGAFDKLDVGVKVRFSPSMGEKGPQASTVERAE